MPRHQPVDYPQVARPTAQLYLGPGSQGGSNRFSWQEGSTEQGPEQTDYTDENAVRNSSVPPLAVLPDTLAGQQQVQQPQPVFHQQDQQQYFMQHAPSQAYQQPVPGQQFRPDVPRNLQQYHQQQYTHPQQQYIQPQQQLPQQQTHPQTYINAPSVPSYEASQAAHESVHQRPQSNMQEQADYHAEHQALHQQQQFSSHAQYVQHQRATIAENFESSEEKPEQDTRQVPTQREIGPDSNPLTSPRSPTSPASPSHNTNIQAYPPMSAMAFSQATPYEQYNSSSGGTWHHGLGSCAEPATCFSGLFCPCIVYGRTQYKLSLKSAKKDPTNMLGYSFINGPCLAWSLLCGVNIFMTAFQHRAIRKTYEMDSTAGNAINDCLTSMCCCCCVVAQGEKEVNVREEKGRVADRGYASPTAMAFEPQS